MELQIVRSKKLVVRQIICHLTNHKSTLVKRQIRAFQGPKLEQNKISAILFMSQYFWSLTEPCSKPHSKCWDTVLMVKLEKALFSISVLTSDFGKLPVSLHLGKDKYFFIIIGKIYTKLGKLRPFWDWECHL